MSNVWVPMDPVDPNNENFRGPSCTCIRSGATALPGHAGGGPWRARAGTVAMLPKMRRVCSPFDGLCSHPFPNRSVSDPFETEILRRSQKASNPGLLDSFGVFEGPIHHKWMTWTWIHPAMPSICMEECSGEVQEGRKGGCHDSTEVRDCGGGKEGRGRRSYLCSSVHTWCCTPLGRRGRSMPSSDNTPPHLRTLSVRRSHGHTHASSPSKFGHPS